MLAQGISCSTVSVPSRASSSPASKVLVLVLATAARQRRSRSGAATSILGRKAERPPPSGRPPSSVPMRAIASDTSQSGGGRGRCHRAGRVRLQTCRRSPGSARRSAASPGRVSWPAPSPAASRAVPRTRPRRALGQLRLRSIGTGLIQCAPSSASVWRSGAGGATLLTTPHRSGGRRTAEPANPDRDDAARARGSSPPTRS